MASKKFLPISRKDLTDRGLKELDVIVVTGDGYADHPSFGAAVIGHVLEQAGFTVGIISQPDWTKTEDFMKLGRPRLFFAVTAGNVDSMVANYTANRKLRSDDDYAPGGKGGSRPDRATIIYTNRIREAFPGALVVIGGIEASLRRVAHYDYWSDSVRRSILLDSKADILVYGMGERQVVEIARRINDQAAKRGLFGIAGTTVARNAADDLKDHVSIPSFEEVRLSKDKFNEAFRIVYSESDPFRGRTIVQKHAERFVIQFRPAMPLTDKEMDSIYGLDYAGGWHPSYKRSGGVPAMETVRFSVISHRGCPGACNFCSLYLHQGRIVQSRSADSVMREVEKLAGRDDFRGTITDIGGPTANLYMASCVLWSKSGACRDKKCLGDSKCGNLKLGYGETLKLWKKIMKIPGVKHLFIGSGVRYDLLVGPESDEYLKELCAHHVSGYLKVAPEHSEEHILRLMNKPLIDLYDKFVKRFNEINRRLKKKQYLVNYIISGHPGSGIKEALNLSLALLERNIHPEQIQDFIPLPMTASGCMYYTGKDPFTGKGLYVARGSRERTIERALIQHKNPANKRYVIEALRRLKRMELLDRFYPFRAAMKKRDK